MTDSPENDAPHSRGPLAVGTVIGGRYRIQGLLGRGGMGVVYAANHELTQRKVALKVLDASPEELPAQRERFLGEARAAAAVRHPNIVDVLDMGTHRGAFYLVMERLEGASLETVINDGRRVSLEQCLSWLLPIIGALATLHHAGIVHRDIKPSNIFLSRGLHQATVPKLLDFGLARAVSDARLTRSGVVIGTPFYMAPEHAAGGAVGPAADVWSMGVVLYECIAGALPYSSTDRAVVAAQVLAGHVRPLRQARPDTPAALAAAIDGALQRDLGLRHASMRALAQALVNAAVSSGIGLPEQVDPLGLPDYPQWKSQAESRLAAGELSSTHELPVAQERPAENSAAGDARPLKYASVALAVAAALALGSWLWPRPAPRAAPPPALPAEAISTPAELAKDAATPGAQLAPPSVEAPTTRPATSAAPVPEADTRKPRRTRAGVDTANKRHRSPPEATKTSPAEVEVEWK